ncbi:MAG: hypothetical protein QW756_06710 [Nitrososphaerota archaeon]
MLVAGVSRASKYRSPTMLVVSTIKVAKAYDMLVEMLAFEIP